MTVKNQPYQVGSQVSLKRTRKTEIMGNVGCMVRQDNGVVNVDDVVAVASVSLSFEKS